MLQWPLFGILPACGCTAAISQGTSYVYLIVPVVAILQFAIHSAVLQIQYNIICTVQCLQVGAALLYAKDVDGRRYKVAVGIVTLVNGIDATEVEACTLVALDATTTILQGDRAYPFAISILVEGIQATHGVVIPFVILGIFIV